MAELVNFPGAYPVASRLSSGQQSISIGQSVMNQPDYSRRGADGSVTKNLLAGARRIASLAAETLIRSDEPLFHPPVCRENLRLAGPGLAQK
jgi:hypothetical protein